MFARGPGKNVLAAISQLGYPAECRRPHPGSPAHPYPRRDQLRHDALRRACLDAVRHRASRQDTYFVAIASLPALDRRSVLDAVERFVGQGVEGIIVNRAADSAVAALSHCPVTFR